MVAPEWFFSTLAQASAAIVGFIVALGTILYSLERQRRANRSDRLRQALIGFKGRYLGVARALFLIANNGGVTTKPYLKDFDHDRDTLREKITDDPEQQAEELTGLFWAHTYRVMKLLERVTPTSDYLLTADELDTLRDSVKWLTACVAVGGDLWKDLYLTLSPGPPSGDVSNSDYRADFIPGDEEGDPGRIIDKWIKHESGGRHRQWAGYSDDDLSLTGQNMYSLATVLQYLSDEVDEIEAMRAGTIVEFDPKIKQLVVGSGLMTLVGVFLPSLFLMGPPTGDWPVVQRQMLVIIQSILLLATGAAFVYLLWLIWSSIHANLRIRETK